MKIKKSFIYFAVSIIVLSLQLVWYQSIPVSLAQDAEPPDSTSLASHTIFLPLVSGDSSGGGGGGNEVDTGSVWLPFTLGDGSIRPSYGASVAVDSQGGIHVVYAIYSGSDDQGNKPATYAHCSAHCGDKANWTYTRLGDAIQDARIALDPNGRPRIMLYGPVYDPDWPRMRYQYAVCDSACANASSWTITTIATPIEPTVTREYDNNHYFAIDKQGHPAFLYTDTIQNNHPGTFYLYCQTNCSNASQWVETLISDSLFDKVSLAFSTDGHPRLAFGYFDANSDLYLSYAQCDAGCTEASNWVGTTLVQIHGTAKYNLAIDTAGNPRMGVFTGSYAYAPFESQKLLYLWCDSGCDVSQNWYFSDTGLAYGTGDGVDLALDRQNRPRMSFETSQQGLGYAWCNSNCNSGEAVWQHQEVESQASLAEDYEVLPIRRCTVSTWFNGQRSSLALDQAGNPRIAYDAQHWWYGTEIVGGVPQSCNYQDVTVTRVTIINQP